MLELTSVNFIRLIAQIILFGKKIALAMAMHLVFYYKTQYSVAIVSVSNQSLIKTDVIQIKVNQC